MDEEKKNQDRLHTTDIWRQERIDIHSFSTIRQGTSTNTLARVRPVEGKNTTIDKITGEATITSGNLMIKIPNYAQLTDLKTSTNQLLDALIIELTETGAKAPRVILGIDDYMRRRGLKDKKEARKQIIGDLDVLLKTSLTWEEKRGNKTEKMAGVNLTDSWAWTDGKKNTIVFTFGQTFFDVLKGYPVMSYPAQLQKLNSNKNPNSYYLLRKITELKNMNVGKANENIVSVKTLLASAPFLPSIEEVMAKDRAYTRRIIDPFERDMDALKDTLGWEYCHSNNTPLTEQESGNITYDLFEQLQIHITWYDYPDQTERLERKAKRIQDANKKKNRVSTRKKTT